MAQQNKTVVAIIELGGKQHLASVGKKIVVNRLQQEVGQAVRSNSLLDKQPVELKVLSHALGEKIRGLKFHAKVRYLRHYGHRQQLTELEVVSIGGQTASKEKESAKETVQKPEVKESAKVVKPVAKKPAAKKPDSKPASKAKKNG